MESVQKKKNPVRRSPRPWSPPPIGWLKANLDAAYDVGSWSGGIGVVVHCLQLVQATKEVEVDDSAFGEVVEDIKTCLAMLQCSHFVHVFRESNNLAHKVAKLAISSGFSGQWFGPLPEGIRGFFGHIV
ncbi:hypothetical protein ACLB2K_026186 [Fragaria x ananassa]